MVNTPTQLSGYVSHIPRPEDIKDWDYNRCVPDLVGQVERLSPRGEVMGFHMGAEYPDPGGWWDGGWNHHWQGIQRLPLALGRHFVVASSENDGDFQDGSHFAVVHMESFAETTGRALGSNRPYDFSAPPTLDRIIHSELIDPNYWHPGGIQTLGRYLFVSVEQGPGRAKLIGYDLAAIETGGVPEKLWEFETSSSGVATAGAAKLSDGRYLLMVTPGGGSKALAFYLTEPGMALDNPMVMGPAAQYEAYFEYDEISNFRTYFQSINLLTDCGGTLYLLGTTGGGTTRAEGGDSGEGDTDRVELYELSLTTGGYPYYPETNHTARLELKASKIMYCHHENGGPRQCDFDAAAGAYVDPDGRLLVYATDYDNDGPHSSIKMMEYVASGAFDAPPPAATLPAIIHLLLR